MGSLRLLFERLTRSIQIGREAHDVHPNGYAMNRCDGILHARDRDGLTNPNVLEPDPVYRKDIDLMVSSSLFHAGHRIRLEASSNKFPRFDRDLKTGSPIDTEARWRLANPGRCVRPRAPLACAPPSHPE